ncbi:MAG: hypothetical protein ONA90_03925, partial [candidate division KSB1 bacterium]|nr:hypothetical protein [candidate division KSB1 bacterium]
MRSFSSVLLQSKKFVLLGVFIFSHPHQAITQTFWQSTNGPYGDRVESLVINSYGHIFAGTTWNGIFRSIDNGNNWVHSGLNNIAITSLAIDRSGHIYAGGAPDHGVFRSTDNGESWSPINAGLTNRNISSLIVNTFGDVFAGTARGGIFCLRNNEQSWINTGLSNEFVRALGVNSQGHIFAGVDWRGIYRSIDNGKSWVLGHEGLPSSFYWSIVANA